MLRWEIQRKVPVSREVVQWNYIDGEHLNVVHGGYSAVDVLYEDGCNSLTRANVSVPFLKFLSLPSIIFVSFPDENTQVTYAHQMFVLSKTTIICTELGRRETLVTTLYEFDLSGWRAILYLPLKILIPKWNQTVWDEDLPLKLRRQTMLDLGFVDFVGLPAKKPTGPPSGSDCFIPLRRPADSPISTHAFFQRTKNRINLRK